MTRTLTSARERRSCRSDSGLGIRRRNAAQEETLSCSVLVVRRAYGTRSSHESTDEDDQNQPSGIGNVKTPAARVHDASSETRGSRASLPPPPANQKRRYDRHRSDDQGVGPTKKDEGGHDHQKPQEPRNPLVLVSHIKRLGRVAASRVALTFPGVHGVGGGGPDGFESVRSSSSSRLVAAEMRLDVVGAGRSPSHRVRQRDRLTGHELAQFNAAVEWAQWAATGSNAVALPEASEVESAA